MKRSLPAACLALATLLALPQSGALAQADPDTGSRPPEEMAREGVELLLRALRGFLDAVPQYGLPRVEDNGDIVIPRLRREDEPTAPDTPRDSVPQESPPQGQDQPTETRS